MGHYDCSRCGSRDPRCDCPPLGATPGGFSTRIKSWGSHGEAELPKPSKPLVDAVAEFASSGALMSMTIVEHEGVDYVIEITTAERYNSLKGR